MKNYGEAFRAMRKRWGLKQYEAASEMGISATTLLGTDHLELQNCMRHISGWE